MGQESLPSFRSEGYRLYTTNFRHLLNRDLVATFMLIKNEYDPWLLVGEGRRFHEALYWYAEHKEAFDLEYSASENLKMVDNVSAAANFWTLSVIHELSLLKINRERAIAYPAGTATWKYDVLGSVRNLYERIVVGEKLIPGDLFEGDILPDSTTRSIELAHRYLEAMNAENENETGECLYMLTQHRDYALPIILEAKDVLTRLLIQKYLQVVVSRA